MALPLAKRLGRPPREVAGELAARLDVADVCEPPEVSGPGFINLRLRESWIADQASRMLDDPRLGVEPAASPLTVVVDYSSPNIAKEMHVGHLRTTIVGDAIVRALEFAGHRVIRDNHVGDWGTQFGMLIEQLLDVGEDSPEAGLLRTDPNAFYQAARRKFDSDPDFAERARKRVVDLQGGDPATLALWQEIVDLSKDYLHRIYGRLGVTLTDADIRGESFYNALLADTVAILEAKGIAVYSDGALCAFPPGFTGREGKPLPLIIRKSDGGYNYATTDLATIRYRVDELGCDRAIYVVGADQTLHFQMVFAVARQAGWIPAGASFEHAAIGLVLGPDGNRLRTRSGDNVQLSDLLTEAVERARGILADLEAPARFQPAELDADRRGGRHRRGEVRRPVHRPGERLRVRLGPDDLLPGQHRPVPAVRDRADPVDLPPGRRGGRYRHPARTRADHRAAGAGAGAAAAGFRRGDHPARPDRRTAPPVRLPVRRGQPVHHVLRGMPGAEGRARVAAGRPARTVRPHAARPDQRPGSARHPGARADVGRHAGSRARYITER